mmetsp:Transcript_42921/g.111283  ORF Transcript_42921/g.111283 Transcript_42921/m.111283 type:complete len:388 (-) Transcript_42921:2-1165(-)
MASGARLLGRAARSLLCGTRGGAGRLVSADAASTAQLAHLVEQHLQEARANSFVCELAEGVRACDRRSVSSAITLCESTSAAHHAQAAHFLHLISEQLPRRRHSDTAPFRIGISGPPGAGKSSLIETMGMKLVERDKVAVLAVDPSSQFSGGAILGDKTRMPRLSHHPSAYVRPSPTRGSLGGVARATSDAVLILEAAGYGTVLVETVGVGQSETAIAELVDCVLLVLPPSGGDDLQAMKRGIMEIADAVVVNKADGETERVAEQSAQQHRSTLGLMPRRWHTWSPKVLACSALTGKGVPELLAMLDTFQSKVAAAGELATRRRAQAGRVTQLGVQQLVLEQLAADPHVAAFLAGSQGGIAALGALPPRCLAQIAAKRFMEERQPKK